MNRKGFSLLELVVVIILISTMTGLAIPRYTQLLDLANATEAIVQFSAARQAMDGCLLKGVRPAQCVAGTPLWIINTVSPNDDPNAKFTYNVAYNINSYEIIATLKTTAVPGIGCEWDGPDLIALREVPSKIGGVKTGNAYKSSRYLINSFKTIS